MKLSTRLTIAMVALVIVTAAAIGLLTYRDLETAILPQTLERLESRAHLRATELESYMRGARSDVLSFRTAAAIEGIIRAHLNGGIHPLDGTSEQTWRARMAKRFVGDLESKRSYLQFRIIGAADGGREIVRVERNATDGAISVVADRDLQRKGEQDYFKETIRMAPGQVYISPIDLNREHGEIEIPYVPVLRVATPIFTLQGAPFGILIVNIDMRPAFDRIRAAVQPGASIYVVNERGDFLVHPDRGREFAFEFGRQDRLQDSIPALAAALTADSPSALMLDDAAGARIAAAAAAVNVADKDRAVVIETVPYGLIMQPVYAARQSILLAALVAVLSAFALAIWLSRSMARPLVQMTGAVQAFAHNGPVAVPINAGGEIGVLAHAFAHMADEMRDKTAALEHEVAQRRRIFETSIDLIMVVDRKGTFIEVNPSATAILGYLPEEMIGRRADEFIHPEDLEHTRNETRMARRGRQIRDFESRYVHKNGHAVTLAWTGVWSEPEQQYFFIGRDMAEQKLAQEMFRLAVEACPSGMIMIDRGGRMVMVNTETEQLFGYGRNELIGKSVDMLVPERMRGQHGRLRNAFTQKPETRRMGYGRTLFAQRKDGSEFPVEIGLNPIRIHDNLLVLGVIVDIDERQRNERMKDEFVSTVSHELRTPLTSIAASLGLLAAGTTGELSDPTMRLLKIAHKNSERLVRLINDILNIEKIESGKIVFDLKRVDVCALIEQAIDGNRGFAETYGVHVRFENGAAPVFLRADPDRLVQVVTNLLSNACKFSPRDGEVAVAVEQLTDTVRITVRDHGPGIPEEFKPRVFEKFAQADATDTRQKGGTGLGLSIVKQIVTLLGGTVGFETPAGGGTVFHVDLPRWELVAGAGDTRVLICDDDELVAKSIMERLDKADLRSEIAATGSEARAKAQATRYDAILVDLTLPDCDGISLIQDLRADARYQNTPIVVISADAARGRDDIRSSSLDVLDWLNKPIDIRLLVEVLDRPLARRAAKRPHILHIDDDDNVLAIVADGLGTTCDVTSVATIERARDALAVHHFDFAVLDLVLSQASGLDLLPELRNGEGNAIPVILYSAKSTNGATSAHVQAALTKSRASIDHLITTLSNHLASCHVLAQNDKEVA